MRQFDNGRFIGEVPVRPAGAVGLVAIVLVVLAASVFECARAGAQDSASAPTPEENAKPAGTPGHSIHADAFNEGPRQAAYLMPGMGNVHWQTSTASPMAQRFFDQGLAQLHGFWYFEAERSFRQAASIDPECAIHYWGMARANIENPKRSEGFIQQAMRRLDSASKVERRLIEAWNDRVTNWPEDRPQDPASPSLESKKRRRSSDASEEVRNQRKERLKRYVKALEDIALDYREDVEIQAMLILQYWQNQSEGIEIQSHAAIDALLMEIFRINPRHPAHHFRIHLWDYRKEELALTAAAQCGPSAPGIAHMWHMPGHTYSRLHRYADAAWQQEASARVDHAHMMRDVIMPDQIHNYAHNNEWLIRNWIFLGRVNAAVSLAKNMIELPRHPDYNTVEGYGSASYGRQRLIAALTTYQRWRELADLCDSAYLLDAEDSEDHRDANLAWKGIAMARLGDLESAVQVREQLAASRKASRSSLAELDSGVPSDSSRPPALLEPFAPPTDLLQSASDPALPEKVDRDFDESAWKDKPAEEKEVAKKRHALRYRYYRLGIVLAALDAHVAAQRQEYRSAVQLSHEAREMVDAMQRIEWCSLAGEHELSVQKINEKLNDSAGQLLPAALATVLTHRAIESLPQHAAIESWKEIRSRAIAKCLELASGCDPNLAWLERARGIAREVSPEMVWGSSLEPPNDLGDRPPLDALGPVRWSPPAAPMWGAIRSNGEEVSSRQMNGKPYVLILYLGFGCLHCAEQLGKFSPEIDRFREAGIEVIGISTENPRSLDEGIKRYDREMRIPLASNASLDVFQAFRCFDDFEGQPLHGTIFVDAAGKIRWQDIGHEPFMDVDFALREAKRLMRISEVRELSLATGN
jgi:peroxiredoxin